MITDGNAYNSQMKLVEEKYKDLFKANVEFTYMNLKGVGHSFTNPQADEFGKKFNIKELKYNQQADELAWATMLQFFKRVFD